MNDNFFSSFEKKVMEMLLEGDNEILKLLRKQYSSAMIEKREFTGVGFFTTFKVNDKDAIIPNRKSFSFGDVIGKIENVKNSIGFVLFVQDGFLNLLEGYTYNEKWPDEIINYHLRFISGNQRDIVKLSEKWN